MSSETRWPNAISVTSLAYDCAYCGKHIASSTGIHGVHATSNRPNEWYVRICPHCARPTYFEGVKQVPSSPFGKPIDHVPPQADSMYNEARHCMAVNAFTAAVMACRKLLANIAVSEGAAPNNSFQFYVDYLFSNGLVPVKWKQWVDTIRTKGNEANHEITLMSREDAEMLISFSGMVLLAIYQFPTQARPVTP